MKKASFILGRKRKKSTTTTAIKQTILLRRSTLAMENQKQEQEDVSLVFWCLELDQETRQRCQDYLNHSSVTLTEAIYYHPADRKSDPPLGSPKKVKRIGSQTFLPDIGSRGEKLPPNNDDGDELGQVLLSLRQHIKTFPNGDDNRDEGSSGSEAIGGATSTFAALNLIQCDLVKVKKYLTFKMIAEQPGQNQSPDPFQIYNRNIMRILNDRNLMLQLLHFECILFRHLKMVWQSFGTQSPLCQDIVLTQMQSFFRNYYTLLIKLSYESAFSQMIKLLHPKSASMTAAILNVYLAMIRVKVSSLVLKKSPTIRQELSDLILTNQDGPFRSNDDDNDDSLDFDKMAKVVDRHFGPDQGEDLQTPQLNLINAARLIFSYSVEYFEISSSVRSRTIVMLCSVGQKLQKTWDRFSWAYVLAPAILKLLECYTRVHIRICDGPLLNLKSADISSLENQEKPAENEMALKSYLHCLRDIYGQLTILLVWADHPLTNRHLRQIGAHRQVVRQFMRPFVRSLNGTEDDDPETLRHLPEAIIEDRGEAYRIWTYYHRLYERIIQYCSRLVIMSSLLAQRLLPPLVLPVEDFQNPFRFDLSAAGGSGCNRHDSHSSDENDFDNDEDDFLNYPAAVVASDEEYTNDASDNDDGDDCDESSPNHNRQQTNNEPETNDHNASSGDQLLARSYLTFFPEMKLFPPDNGDRSSDDQQDYPLSCSCVADDVDNLSDKLYFPMKPTNPAEYDDDGMAEFLRQELHRNFDTTQSVIPRIKISEPELKCFEQDQVMPTPEANDSLMTYPFLKRVLRYKNYFHIKLLDHVEERLDTVQDSDYDDQTKSDDDILVYDVEKNVSSAVPDECLRFESRFECGNLHKVFRRRQKNRRDDQEYILLLNSDVNSSSHTQWFYFSITGVRPGRRYRFKIINCEKKSILYNRGQRPLFYLSGTNRWQRSTDRDMVASYRNHYVKDGNKMRGKPFYTLEFTFEFSDHHHFQDELYLAFNMPFSYSLLKTCISRWRRMAAPELFFHSQPLCSTLNGNDMPLLTITSKNFSTRKHYVVITGRVHPAESNSSWMAKGLVDFLVTGVGDGHQDEQISRQRLLDRYIFKIIPMLNPDGVINGCTRTDLQTEDLNRHWADPSPILYPTIFHARLLVQCLHRMSNGRNPVAFIDLHGHSGRHNIFSYSCFPMLSWKKSDRQAFYKQTILDHPCLCDWKNDCHLRQRVESLNNQSDGSKYLILPPFMTLPLALLQDRHRPCPTIDPDGCCFVMQREREQTARMVAWRHFQIPWSYTIECSAAGCSRGPYAGQCLSRAQMEETGRCLALAFDSVKFVFCSQQHFPVMIRTEEEKTKTDNRNQKSVYECLVNKCVRNRNPFKTHKDTPKQKRLKETIRCLYPDLQ